MVHVLPTSMDIANLTISKFFYNTTTDLYAKVSKDRQIFMCLSIKHSLF